MKKNNLKSLIAMGLVLASTITITAPTVVNALEVTNSEYKTIFKEDTRKILSYEQLREKWLELLTGNILAGKNDNDAMKNIEIMDRKVEEAIKTAILEGDNIHIWESLIDSKSLSATITAQFKRIKEISIAYKTKDSKYYNNTELLDLIVKATEKMYTNHYNETVTKTVNNWWDWQIGTPRELVDIIILINEEFGELKGKLIKTIDRFVPDATQRLNSSLVPTTLKETGANLLDKALIVAVRGIAEGNDERVKHAATVSQDIFPYVTNGDGFYKDGSFVQHSNIAYTGSYGAVLINSLSNLLFIVQDTEFKIDTKEYYNLFRWMKDSYEPIVAIGGNVMDNVRGRAISRIAQQGDERGKFIISSMLRIANIAPNKEAENYIKSITKRWISDAVKSNKEYFVGISTGDVASMKNVLNDKSVEVAADRNYYKQFYYMDRAVSNRPEYNFSVSMSSTRIANHEDINGESTKAWYTGQGMTQLYTNDLQQYNEDFWPTVDPMRLPGVTSDGQTRKFKDTANSSAWAGGTTIDGVNGVSGMEILPTYLTAEGKQSGMSARKSWFMFENEIVALGSNISSADKNVETIIDNRKLKDSADNKFIIDGKEAVSKVGDNVSIEANWAHLEGNVTGSDIGYVFPSKTEIKTKRETRTNKWSDINTKPEFIDTEDKTKSYLSLAVEHGNSPKSGKYEYVILPNATAKETADYSTNQKIKVLANNNSFHAVYHETEKIYAINVFEATKISESLEVSGPASIMIKLEDNGGYKVSVSNPTKLENKIDFIFSMDNIGDFDISGECIESKNIISVNTSSKTGETYEFNITPKKVDVDKITIDKENLELVVGDTDKLNVTINPDNATDKTIHWSSSEESIVKVDETGNIEALSVGKAEIKAIVDGKEAICSVTVKEKPIIEDENDDNTNNEDKNENNVSGDKPQTGDSASVATLGLAMLASFGGILALKKKKK